MTRVQLSHQNVEKLSAVMAQKGLKDYGDVLSDAINYPKGTFTEVGSPVCDGQGVSVRIGWELWRDADLTVIAKRGMFESVSEMVESYLTH